MGKNKNKNPNAKSSGPSGPSSSSSSSSSAAAAAATTTTATSSNSNASMMMTSKPKNLSAPVAFGRKTEDLVVQIVSGEKKKSGGGNEGGKKVDARKVGRVLDDLLEIGFAREDAEECIRRTKTSNLDEALDYLCLNLPEERLPRKFKSKFRPCETVGKIEVVRASKNVDAASASERRYDVAGPIVTAEYKRGNEDDANAAKDWIKRRAQRYSDDDDDDDDNDDSDGDDGEPYDKDDILYARDDPKDKKFLFRGDPHARLQQLEKEFEVAKIAANKAKQSGNEEQKASTTKQIRQLRQEIDDIKDILKGGVGVSQAKEVVKERERRDKRDQEEEEDDAGGDMFSFFDNMGISGDDKNKTTNKKKEKAKEEKVVVAPPPAAAAADDEDQGLLSFMGEEAEEMAAMIREQEELQKQKEEEETEAAVQAESMLEMELESGIRRPVLQGKEIAIAMKGWRGKAPQDVLQQHCNKLEIGPPQYERAGKSVHLFLFSVRIAPARGKANKITGKNGQIFMEDYRGDGSGDGGYDTSTLGKQAAACHALRALSGGQQLHRLLPTPFKDLWYYWDARDKMNKDRAKEGEKENRSKYIQSLLQQSEEQKNGGANGDNEDEENEEIDDGYADSDDDEGKHKVPSSIYSQSESDVISPLGQKLRDEFLELEKSEGFQKMLLQRRALPIHEKAGEIIEILKSHQAMVLVGETGCGKTTQVPQFILEDALRQGKGDKCHIVCTQPRRISAIGVADRVTEERCESVHEKAGLVGHQVRLDSRISAATRLLFCTTGVLLRRVVDSPHLSHVSHIIVDEAHERDVLSDFLLIFLKRLLKARSDIRIIIMSATIQAEKFSQYLGDCPIVTVQGRTFPVRSLFLEDILAATGYRIAAGHECALKDSAENMERTTLDVTGKGGHVSSVALSWTREENEAVNPSYALDPSRFSDYPADVIKSMKRVDESRINFDLIEEILDYIERCGGTGGTGGGRAAAASTTATVMKEGAELPSKALPGVLIFMPGLADITEMMDRLTTHRKFGNPKKYLVLAAHSCLSPEEQRKIFQKTPAGIRKIVVATNIAETSITVEDVVFVIDTGRHKQTRYHQKKRLRSLEEEWVDAASMKQRQGRAGRVRPGVCFHLYSSVTSSQFTYSALPEMLRVPLEELILQIKLMQMGTAIDVLGESLDPPHISAISAATESLTQVGALDSTTEELTPLGRHLAQIPVDPHIGKLLVLASLFDCLSPALTIAAMIGYRSPFLASLEQRGQVETAKLSLAGPNSVSDFAPVIKAYNGWLQARQSGAAAAKAFCRKYSLSEHSLYQLQAMRSQLQTMLSSIGFMQRTKFDAGEQTNKANNNNNSNKAEEALLIGVLCAALWPNVAQVSSIDRHINVVTRNGSATVHPSSLIKTPNVGALIAFHEQMKTHKVFLLNCVVLPRAAVLMFGGSLKVFHEKSVICVDGWLEVAATARVAVLLRELRDILDSLLQESYAHTSVSKKYTQSRKISSKAELMAKTQKLKTAVTALLLEEDAQ